MSQYLSWYLANFADYVAVLVAWLLGPTVALNSVDFGGKG